MYQEVSLSLLRKFDPLALSPLARDRAYYYSFKHVLDLTMAFLALVILLPLMVLIAVLIVIDSPGPIIFAQKRVGARRWVRDGYSYWQQTIFTFYKFRSMVSYADSSLHQAFIAAFVNGRVEMLNPSSAEFKLTQDPRVTRIGRILRKTSLDELPQLVNVLKGDMSLVGPRPALPYEVELYQEWHRCRLQALPGITGWWQVMGRSRVTFDEMVRMDRHYIEHQSLGLDLKILFRTPWAVISGRGAA